MRSKTKRLPIWQLEQIYDLNKLGYTPAQIEISINEMSSDSQQLNIHDIINHNTYAHHALVEIVRNTWSARRNQSLAYIDKSLMDLSLSFPDAIDSRW